MKNKKQNLVEMQISCPIDLHEWISENAANNDLNINEQLVNFLQKLKEEESQFAEKLPEREVLKIIGRNNSSKSKRTPMTTTEIAKLLGYDKPDATKIRAVGVAMRMCGYVPKSTRVNGLPVKAYMVLAR